MKVAQFAENIVKLLDTEGVKWQISYVYIIFQLLCNCVALLLQAQWYCVVCTVTTTQYSHEDLKKYTEKVAFYLNTFMQNK